jgi:hypothetical protein
MKEDGAKRHVYANKRTTSLSSDYVECLLFKIKNPYSLGTLRESNADFSTNFSGVISHPRRLEKEFRPEWPATEA